MCPEYCLRLVGLDKIKGNETLTALYVNRYGKLPEGSTGSAIIKMRTDAYGAAFALTAALLTL